MKVRRILLSALIALIACCNLSLAKTEKRHLKDVQLKIPLQIRARPFCTDADCVKTCPIDYDLDSEKQYCRYKRASCPGNYIRRHGSCVLQDVQCPPGSIRQGNRCVVKSLECPAGYVLEGTNCVNSKYCPNGYHWENGFCYQQQRKQSCPSGYEIQNGMCIQICVNCEAACAECDEETVPLKCPSGYEPYRGRCLKILQGRADVVVRTATYKVSVECENDEVYSDGSCVSWKYDNVQCSIGHFYNGKCVEVAKCSKGLLQNSCECLIEDRFPATCRQGQLSPMGCVTAKAQCRKPAQLINNSCVRKVDSHKAFCTRGTPLNDVFCDVGTPHCPNGFTLDGSFCKRNHSYPLNCGRYRLQDSWCTSNAECGYGYKYENGTCVQELLDKEDPCPPSTIYDGEHCAHNEPLCKPDQVYDNRYGICVKCIEKLVVCDETAGFRLSDGVCVRYEPLCPVDYTWNNNHCSRKHYYNCSQGYLYENYCVHSHLNCPDDYEIVDNFCLKSEPPSCPEESTFQNGLCVTDQQCPAGYTPDVNCCVRETHSPLNNSSFKPTCPADFHYDNGNCIRTIWRNATVESRPGQCPKGYKLSEGRCIREYYGILVCPPKTILMNERNNCFCKVDLICPNGYERMGDECIFRSLNYYSSFLNFLNPCYGIQCGLQYCLTQCFSPPCPVQLCSFGSYQQPNPMYVGNFQHASSDLCGVGETCTTNEQHETVVSLICPPGYNRENGTCVAYYDRTCQTGYKLRAGRCIKTDLVKEMCPLGFTQTNESCIRAQCDAGYVLDGMICKKVEYRTTIPCPKNYVLVGDTCINRGDCVGGSIEGNVCVRREYAPYSCPPNFILHNETCITHGSCSTRDLFLLGNVCRSRDSLTLECPSDTKRVGNMCVYLEAPKCENADTLTTNCTGQLYQGDLCAYIETPSCNRGYVLRDGKCLLCTCAAPSCPSDMVIIDGKCVKHRKPSKSGRYINKQGQYVSVKIKPASCQQGTLCSGKCIHGLPACKAGYRIEGDVCKTSELQIATCTNGILRYGKCVEQIRCDGAMYALTKGWCVRNDCSEPTCSSKTTRVRDLCINGAPKCPENHCMLNGYCYLNQVQPAKCSSGGKCLDNFCHLTYPSCSPSFDFDGSVCKSVALRGPKCPVGTIPDPTDRSYCLYSSEQADFYCPSEFYYKNGICQKRQYVEATCPSGFRRKVDRCVRKSCSSSSLTTYCGTHGLTPSTFKPIDSNHNFVGHVSPNYTTVPQSETCCRIYSPRICQKEETSQEWRCYHTESPRCGPFCSYQGQRIYLRTAIPYNLNGRLILTPPEGNTSTYENENGDHSGDDDEYVDDTDPDCDECSDLSYDCSSYCYTFDCHKDEQGCVFQEQEEFCRKYPGAGCTTKDGCHDRSFCEV